MASKKRSDGEGSIYYVANRNVWKGSLVVTWRDGKPVRRTVTARSKAKAAQRLRELQEKLNRGDLPIGRAPTVEEWMRVWLTVAEREVRPSTFGGYTSKVERYIVPLLGRHRLDKLRAEHIEEAWHRLRIEGRPDGGGKALAPRSVLQTHRILSHALTVAVERGYAPRNPCSHVKAPKAPDVDIEPLTRAQARRVLETCRQLRNGARWSVALSLGLRQGEALGLTWRDVDLDGGTLSVRRSLQRIRGQGLQLGPLKSDTSRRTIALPASLVAEFRAHRKAQAEERLRAGSMWADEWDLVFTQTNGKPIDPRADWQAWRDLLEAADVPAQRLHNARHTAATLLLLQGVSTRAAMGILGHSQVNMTMRYQSLPEEVHVDAAARMDTALWGEA